MKSSVGDPETHRPNKECECTTLNWQAERDVRSWNWQMNNFFAGNTSKLLRVKGDSCEIQRFFLSTWQAVYCVQDQ